jgi:glycosyltransferase involved in cell wall biosynthesis
VIAKNEDAGLKDCLDSVRDWAAELIVVDDQSSDRTVEVARAYTDRVVVRKMVNEGRHRNEAYALASHPWVLSLDADEQVTPELKAGIDVVLADPVCWAWAIPIRTYIGDYWVRYCGWYPASKLRLFHKDHFRYEEAEVHPRAFLDGPQGTLTADIIHRGYPDFEHFLASLNRQTTLEARKWIRTGREMPRVRILRRTVDRFLRVYFRKKGFKDGFVGFMVAFFAALYQIMSYAKYWEMKRRIKQA